MKNAIWKYSDLERLLEKDFPLMRRWAFEKLVNLYSRSKPDRIADLIDDSDEYISSGAIRHLGAHDDKKWAFRILRKFQESSGTVAASCAIALGELGYTDAIHFFRQRVEDEDADFETLIGIITALKHMPCVASTDLLLYIGDMYSASSNGVFLSKVCDALLSTRDRHAVQLVTGLYMEHAFSLDDGGRGVLRCIIRHTQSLEFIDEFRSFIEERPFDILKYIKESVRHRLGEILGNEFIRKTAEKFLKTNYLQLLGDIRQTAEMVLYSKKIIRCDEDLEDPHIRSQEIFNYHFIDRFSGEARLLNVMNLGEVKKIIILCICALLRIVYSKRAVKLVDINVTDDISVLLRELDVTTEPDAVIRRVVKLSDNTREADLVREKVSRNLKRNGGPQHIVRYLKILSRLQPDKDLDIFWNHLDIKQDNAVCQAAEDGMVAAGKDAVEFIEKKFESGDESQKMFSLGILSRIPLNRSINLIQKNFDMMWENYRDFVLYAVNELGSRKFIKPILKKLLESPAPDIQETYLLLCDLNGVEDNRLDGVRARVMEELEKTDGGIDIECDRSKALRRNHCNRKLICRHCDLSRLKAQ